MPEFEIITSVSRLLEIESAWARLASAIPNVTPFQLPCWQLSWWRHFGSGQLRVFVYWDGDALTGIVPCFLHAWEGRQQLTLIGSGVSDYLDPLIHPDSTWPVIVGLQSWLGANSEWDVCNWQDLSADTCLAQMHGSALEADTICSEAVIGGSFEDFWNSRPKDMRRNVRRYTERARSMGPVSFHVVSSADSALLEALIRLHAARWEKRGEPGMIAVNNSAGFLSDVACSFAERNILRFFAITFQERIAALVLTFLHRNKIYSYLSAFDPQHEILGFGRTLLHEAFRYCFENNYAAWNFCRGDEHYKFSWGAQPIEKRRLILTRDKSVNSPPPCGY